MDEKEVSEMQEEMMTVLVVEPMKAPYDVLTAFGYRDAETSFLQDPLSVSEISLIKSYREHKEMQTAVHKLLDLPAPVTRTRRKRKPKKSNPEV